MDKAAVTLFGATLRPVPDRQLDGVQRQPSAERTDGSRAGMAGAVDRAELDRAVDQINDFVQVVKRDLEFSVDDNTGRTIITVFDADTQEIIRQIPPEKVLAVAENIREVRGLLFEGEA